MSRLLLVALAVAFAAGPASAQVHVRGLANAGYDAGYGAASVGAGAELAWAPAGSPVSVALRPSADLVFVNSQTYDATPRPGGPPLRDRYTANVTRASAEAVVRWAAGPVAPYLKAGITTEYEQILIGDVDSGRWQEDAVAGAGAAFDRVYAEGTLGFGDASRSRLVLGVRF